MSILLGDDAAALFDLGDRQLLEAVVRMAFSNAFSAARDQAMRDALGSAFCDAGPVWSLCSAGAARRNLQLLRARLARILARPAARLARGGVAPRSDLVLYQEACFFFLFDGHDEQLQLLIERRMAPKELSALYRRFVVEFDRLLGPLAGVLPVPAPAHVFACCYQIRRAFHFIFAHVAGTSAEAARLREVMWQAIFGRNLRRFLHGLHERMDDNHVLVTGPTGTGKELVAQAIGYARYIPFDPDAARFESDYQALFVPIHLAGMARGVIESELFGHEKGAFTGATAAQPGLLETSLPSTVFLDEVGEIKLDIQTKLLRVTQARELRRVGGRQMRRFRGRIVAATHRDLEAMVRRGTFREDLFYRLAILQIETPTLRAQLDAAPGDLAVLVRFLAEKVAGPALADEVSAEVVAWIEEHLPPTYAWPGNVRQLEACVRSILMGGGFKPANTTRAHRAVPAGALEDPFLRAVLEGRLTLDDLDRAYIRLVYEQTGSLRRAAQQLGIDRSTVAAKMGAPAKRAG
jgi:transcriptional regulator with AAA-type ATPase domain